MGQPEAGASASGGMTGEGSDPDAVFRRSLGEFDGEMGREQARMAGSGEGSVGAAAAREAADAAAVSGAGAGGGRGRDSTASRPGIGGVDGGMSGGRFGGIGGAEGPRDARGTRAGEATDGAPGGGDAGGGGGADAGTGSPDVLEETEVPAAGEVAQVPPDIPADPGAEDPVARQLREAAQAESDPEIREALWNEYRRKMGIREPR